MLDILLRVTVWAIGLWLFTLLTACTPKVSVYPVNASRADATVKVKSDPYNTSFSGPKERVGPSGKSQALKICQRWGYEGAEDMSPIIETCTAINGYGGCIQEVETQTFQCF